MQSQQIARRLPTSGVAQEQEQEAEVKRVRIPSRVKEEEEGLSSDPEERWTTTEQLEDLLSVL